MEKNHSLNLNTVATKKKLVCFLDRGRSNGPTDVKTYICCCLQFFLYRNHLYETFTIEITIRYRFLWNVFKQQPGSRFYIGFKAVVRLHIKQMRRPQKKIHSKNVNRNSKFSIGIACDTKIYCHLAEIHQKMAQVKDFFDFRSMGKEWNHWNTCFCFRSVS